MSTVSETGWAMHALLLRERAGQWVSVAQAHALVIEAGLAEDITPGYVKAMLRTIAHEGYMERRDGAGHALFKPRRFPCNCWMRQVDELWKPVRREQLKSEQ